MLSNGVRTYKTCVRASRAAIGTYEYKQEAGAMVRCPEVDVSVESTVMNVVWKGGELTE